MRLLLILVLLVAGVATAGFYGVAKWSEARATRSWPTVEGVVTGGEIVRRSGRNAARPYELRLSYVYSVDGERCAGDRWNVFGPQRFAQRADADRALAEHPVGTAVEVRVSPDDPSRAVLIAGGERKAWLVIGFGAFLFAAGAFLAVRNLA